MSDRAVIVTMKTLLQLLMSDLAVIVMMKTLLQLVTSDRAVIVTIKNLLQLVMSDRAVIVYDENPPLTSDEWPRCHCIRWKPSFNKWWVTALSF